MANHGRRYNGSPPRRKFWSAERVGRIHFWDDETLVIEDALTGFTIELTHLDGHKVNIVRDKITWPGARIRKKGEGMPNYNNNNLQGTLYITFDVEFPKQELTEDDKLALKKILNQSSNNKVYNGLRGY